MRRVPTTRLHFGGLLIAEAGLILTATRSVDLIARVDCPIRALIGVQCPGCGSTRCIQSLGEVDVFSAFRHNPLLLSLLAFVMLYLVYGLVAPPRAAEFVSRMSAQQRVIALATVGIVTAFTVLRNITGTADGAAVVAHIANELVS